MNRRERRAAQSKLHEEAKKGRRALALKPKDAQAHNELACVLLQQGQLEEAAAEFARALSLMPELFDQYANIVATLMSVNPAARAGVALVASVWPREVRGDEVLAPGAVAKIFADPLLRCVLELATVRDLNLERYLTAARRIVLDIALSRGGESSQGSLLGFCCALARQCFINEYAFAASSQELDKASGLRDTLVEAMDAGNAVAPLLLTAVATYFPLNGVPGSQRLLEKNWPEPVRSLLAQQVLAPAEEQRLLHDIPRLTPIANEVSLLVKQQYEENPYPRWVALPSDRGAVRVSEYLREQFPTASFHAAGDEKTIDVLVAGCGTGQQAILTARRFSGARVLAVDLSLASLCYAKRMSRTFGVQNIEYAQADVLELGSLGRTFHVIEASGVLHHLADPFAGWRVLGSMLKPRGFMHIGLYSKLARAQIAAARTFLAGKGIQPSAGEIRRWRQEILVTPMKSVASFADYFSISECRDLLFHVQEHQLTIAEIDSFLRENGLHFIGFELAPQVKANYRFRFPEDPSLTKLASWEAFEKENPSTFAGMYQFWIQKN